jgi:putative redox protein
MPRSVIVRESGQGKYEELVAIGPHALRADEGQKVGGGDSGPSPYEYVMAGLGACTLMTLRMSAARHGWPLEQASVTVQHKMIVSADGKTTVDRFEREIDLIGTLTDEQRTHLPEVADECPVSKTLQRASVIVSSLAEGKQI